MPATIYYKGSFYFVSLAELQEVIHLIEKETSHALLNVDESGKKLSIELSGTFDKRDALQAIFSNAATYAASGMVLAYDNGTFADVFCANRCNEFNPERCSIIMFTLREFEETFGKLHMKIPELVYDSPFYIYEQSLEDIGPAFEDEIPISEEDCDTGFTILKKIWKDYVAHSGSPVFSIVFKLYEGSKPGVHAVKGTYGFAPGYSFEKAVEEAIKCNFMVLRWSDFWDDKYVIRN
ncbi:hypothetical protein OGH69_16095 [Flavobacterium sp. MFBS3-15]|uniref:hypothetical protein n=1 Tax=Flavobacterium sp. MFBS3-15 TaxID=2989816 RepID=UPI002236A631|nr:hypothetical protein [Flavobacterium sp. MFBS3-15]MCW4470494.1 hypothetical protein [Flavobacterium sp. MFBS3-15]